MSARRSRQRWALGLISAASLMAALYTLVVSTALSTIRNDLHASVEELEWTVNAYNLTLADGVGPAFGVAAAFGLIGALAAAAVPGRAADAMGGAAETTIPQPPPGQRQPMTTLRSGAITGLRRRVR